MNTPRRKKFTDEQFMKLYKEGLNDAEIARRLGVSATSVRDRRKQLGLPPIRRKKKSPRVNPDIILKLSKQGLTVKEIARRLGVSKTTVSKWRKRFGVARKIAYRRKPQPQHAVIRIDGITHSRSIEIEALLIQYNEIHGLVKALREFEKFYNVVTDNTEILSQYIRAKIQATPFYEKLKTLPEETVDTYINTLLREFLSLLRFLHHEVKESLMDVEWKLRERWNRALRRFAHFRILHIEPMT